MAPRASSAVRIVLATAILIVSAAAIALAASRSSDLAPGVRSTTAWEPLTASPLMRTEVGAARIGDRIYVVGGFDSGGGTTGAMVAYDISSDDWRRRAPLPIEVNHPGVTAHRGSLYLYGGNLTASGGTEPKSDRLYRYDPRRNDWNRLADAPSGRAAMAFVAIGGKLFAAGGYTSADPTLRELAIYNVRLDRWTSGPEMPTGRNHVGAAELNRKMLVTGGRPGEVNGGLTTVESYNPRRRRWTRLPSLATARSGHAAVSTRGQLVVFGGEELIAGGTTIERTEAFDPRTRSWSELPPMVTPRHGLGAAARRGRVYALEGGPAPGLAYSGALEFLDLER